MLIVLGGSSPWTARLLGLLRAEPVLLVGRDEQALGHLRRFVRHRWGTRVGISTDPVHALRTDGVVLCQARVGGWGGRRVDEETPRRWGCVGDETVGLGGLRAAMRARETVAHWARASGTNPTLVFSNPTDLLTRWWSEHAGSEAVSVCEVPTELVQPLPDGTSYLGVTHLGAARTPDGRTVPTGQLAALGDGSWLASQSVRVPRRADELAALSARLRQAVADLDFDGFDRLCSARRTSWYESILVPAIGALSGDRPARLILGTRNDGRIPDLSPDVVVEGYGRFGRARHEVEVPPAELGDAMAAVGHSRDLAWRFLRSEDPDVLRAFMSRDPASSADGFRTETVDWMVEA